MQSIVVGSGCGGLLVLHMIAEISTPGNIYTYTFYNIGD